MPRSSAIAILFCLLPVLNEPGPRLHGSAALGQTPQWEVKVGDSSEGPARTIVAAGAPAGPAFASDEIIVRWAPEFSKTCEKAMREGRAAPLLAKAFPSLARAGGPRIKPLFEAPGDRRNGPVLGNGEPEDRAAAFRRHAQAVAQRNPHRKAAEIVPDLSAIYRVTVPPGAKVKELCLALQADAQRVVYAEPKYVARTCLPDDTYIDPDDDGEWATGAWSQAFRDLWGMHRIQADAAWQAGAQGGGLVVAVVDTGVDYTHEDLAVNIWVNAAETPNDGLDNDGNGFVDDVHGYDFATTNGAGAVKPRDADPADGHGHGTHVAGTIAAVIDNGLGVAGLAPQTRIMAIKGLSDNGQGFDADLADAVRYAADNGAAVISNSWGGRFYSQVLVDTFRYAHALGCVSVAAAGNSASAVAEFSPANIDAVIAVAATDSSDVKASFSNFGSLIDVAAPGVDVLSLRAAGTDIYNDGQHFVPPGNSSARYYRSNGTSMACPHVAALAAVWMAAHPGYSNEQVRQAVRVSAQDLGAPGFDVLYGSGRIDAAAALAVSDVPEVWIEPVGDKDEMLTATDIRGTASGTNFASYTLAYGSVASGQMYTIVPSSVPVSDGVLAAGWFPAQAVNEQAYDVLLTVTDTLGKTYRISRRVSVPFRVITRPRQQQILAGEALLAIHGTATYPTDSFSFTLTHAPQGSGQWTNAGISIVNGGTTPVVKGLLGTLDCSVVPQTGFYDLRLTIQFGANSTSTQKSIYIDKQIAQGFPIAIEATELTTGTLTLEEGPTLADLDGDGAAEMTFTYGNKVYVYNGAGQHASGWPFDISPYSTELIQLGAPVYPDPDHPGRMAVMAGENVTRLYHLDYQGMLKPGFPVSTSVTHAAIADLNNDGTLEVVAKSGFISRKLGVLNLTGQFLPGWPLTLDFSNGLPTVADIADAPGLEIALIQRKTASTTEVRVYDRQSQVQPGWPLTLSVANGYDHPAIAADMDADDGKEVIAAEFNGSRMHVLRGDGTELPNWPITVTGRFQSAPSAADLDGDSVPEIIAIEIVSSPSEARVHVWNAQGQSLSGWPRVVTPGNLTSWAGGCAAVGNIDDDPAPEILLSANTNRLHAFHANGDPVAGFPKFAGGAGVYRGQPAIGDVDGDGLTEIAFLSFATFVDNGLLGVENLLTVWRTDSPYSACTMQWPMVGHNPAHTHAYDSPVSEACPRPTLLSAASRKTHAGVGNFDINLLAGQTECRSAQLGSPAGSLLIVAEFNTAVALLGLAGGDVTSDVGVVGPVSVAGAILQVQLLQIPNAGPAHLAFPGVCDSSSPGASTASTATLCVRVAVGDYNGSGRTDFLDFAAINGQGLIGTPTGTTSFRADINLDGQINEGDLSGVKNAGLVDGPAVACP